MGGGAVCIPASSVDEVDLSTAKPQVLDRFSEKLTSESGDFRCNTAEENEFVFGESDVRGSLYSYKTSEIEANERRMRHVYAEVFRSYGELKQRIENLEAIKSKVLSYTPGSWVENVGGLTICDYDLPKTTTLLLIGPKGSGKSSLVNRISRVFEEDKLAPERAQITNTAAIEDGTFFLQEFNVPRSSTSFCLYDTRSYSNDLSENLKMIKRWMTKGVCHGELVKMASDSSSLKAKMRHNARQDKLSYRRKMVNFVIFVVNGLSVLKCVDSDGTETQYTEMVAGLFDSPFLSFRDHKPAIAITHGDLLSLSERARVRVYLGELLGVHPSKQTFDVPDNFERTSDLAIIDMVRYALEHADRNLPSKRSRMINKDCMICIIQLYAFVLLLLAMGMIIMTVQTREIRSLEVDQESGSGPEIDWKTIRHIWAG